jgi:type VI secretion system protein ImpA
MASSEVLDFELLLAPIAGDNPTGVSLRDDYSPTSSYNTIKTARDAARAAERQMVMTGDAPVGPVAGWEPILKLGTKILGEESKNLEVAAWLTEALVRKYGFAGLRDGFRLLRELSERFWDGLYPLPDEDGVIARVAPLTGLNGQESDGVLLKPIANIPITARGAQRPFTLADYKRACEISGISDPEKRARMIDQGMPTLEKFEQASRETSAEFWRDLVEDLEACREEFHRLCDIIEEKCGKDDDGFSLAPPTSNIRNALEKAHEDVLNLSRGRLADSSAQTAEAGESTMLVASDANTPMVGGTVAGSVASRVQTREDAFRLLLQVAEFFKRTEPHSPVSYALEQAVRWGKMPLPDLWAELVPDESARSQLFKIVGIQPPEAHADY